MSTRAYKIIQVQQEKEPTFNLSHNFDWLEPIADNTEYDDGNGCRNISFMQDDIEMAIKDYKDDKEKLEVLKNILKDFGEDNCVEYNCY